MATAVQSTAEPRTPNPRARLALASLAGAGFVLGGVAVAAYLVPELWRRAAEPVVRPALGTFVDVALRLTAQAAAAAAIIWVGTRAAGSNPPRGLRGGIFLAISALITIFFVARAVGLNLEETPYGLPVTLVVLGGLLGAGYRLLASPKAVGWMHALEDQGWFHTFNYKRTQGVRARRYTLVGLLLVGWSGVYTLLSHASLGTGDWTLRVPFVGEGGASKVLTVLSDIEYAVPVLLGVAAFWLAWRAVNMPAFADFLVATEAEMNKVSWSSRKRLAQDTVVVMVTLVVLTVFLLAVDLFWGWLLSRDLVGVLPPRSTGANQVTVEGRQAEW